MPCRIEPAVGSESPISTDGIQTRTTPLGIAALPDTIESMAGAPTEKGSDCLTNFLHCLASPFIAFWNWLCGLCSSKSTNAHISQVEHFFNQEYKLLLARSTGQLDRKEATIVYKDGQPIFFQFEKKSADTDRFKDPTTPQLRSALENLTSDATYAITVMFLEKGSDIIRPYNAYYFTMTVDGPGEQLDIDKYQATGASERRVQQIMDGMFNQDQITELTDFFFSED